MVTVRFYGFFVKKPNSFKIPSASTPYTDVTGEIKGDFSPYAPVVRFSNSAFSPSSVPLSTYCYISKFSRYYFVEWAMVSGCWEGSLTCDVLGSFRTFALASSQYVARSESAYNSYLIDSACTPTTNVQTALAAVTQEQVWGSNYESGTYVIGVVAPSAGKNTGAVVYYAMSQLGFSALMYALLVSPNWMQIDPSEISYDLQKALINPAQYIVSAVWLPIDSATFIGTSSEYGADVTDTIKFGWWDFNLGVNSRILHQPTSVYDSYSKWLVIDYGLHPETVAYGNWVNVSPYTKITLDFPPFGCIDLDTTDLNPAVHKISIHVFVHAYNGDATAYIFNGDKEIYPDTTFLIGTLRANIGVQLPVGQIRMNIGNWQNAAALAAATGAEELVNVIMGS